MLHILLIDDESSVTDAIENRLSEKFGRTCKIYAANNFFRARELLSDPNLTFNFIISDLLLPRRGSMIPDSYGNGTTLAGWFFLHFHILQSNGEYYEKSKNTKIILFSAYGDVWQNYIKNGEKNGSVDMSRVKLVQKGYIYNDTGGYEKLLKQVEDMQTQ